MANWHLADWILACAAAPEDRRALLGDLVEEYAVRRDDSSRAAARCWYWAQVLRSIPWLLWMPVRRHGWISTLGAALAVCALQAGIEVVTASVLPRVIGSTAGAYIPLALSIVIGSLLAASSAASRVRPGAGTMVACIVMASMLTRAAHSGGSSAGLADALEAMCAASAALAGSSLAVNSRRWRAS